MAIDRTKDTWAARKAGQPKTTGSLQPVPGRCGAQLSYTGSGPENPPRYCMQFPARKSVNGRCKRFHAGTAPIGPDATGFKDGRHSKYLVLGPKLLEQFEKSLNDERLLDLKPDVALLDTMLWQAAEGLDGGAGAEQWRAAKDAFQQLQKATTKAAAKAAMERLEAVLTKGDAVATAREETGRLAERRAKVVRTHQQLQVEAEDLVPARKVGVAFTIMAALVREFIPDDARRREFTVRFVGALAPRLRAAGEPAAEVRPDGPAAG